VTNLRGEPSPQIERLPPPRFILASASTRRQQLLRDAGYEFDVDPPDIDETTPPGLLPSKVALHLAETKAKAVAARHPDEVVLAADTVVAFGDQLLGKPDDAAHAKQMLQLLAGTTHLVITGVCVTRQSPAFFKSTRVMSAVKMRFLTPAEIDRYVESREWEGKAGGYGIQDKDPFVVRQSGSHTNIVGLPMSVTKRLLEEAGITPARSD
jgi:septum formation protein